MRPRLPIWMEAEFVIRRDGDSTAVVRRSILADFRRLGLAGAAARPPGEIGPPGPGRAAGRGTLAVVALEGEEGGEAVVRPYRRGGLPGRVLDRRYFLGARAFDELALTERLRLAGLPVPEPLAAVQAARFPGYRAALVTRLVPAVRPAAELLADADRASTGALLRRMGRSVGRLHRAGAWHADLNAANLLLDPRDPDAPAVIVDLDRGRAFLPPLPGFLARRNLARLRRSLAKLGLREASAAWAAFEAGYAEGGAAPPPHAASGSRSTKRAGTGSAGHTSSPPS